MDESKLSKSDANRKPREFTLVVRGPIEDESCWEWEVIGTKPSAYHDDISVVEVFDREMLPQDDSLRVSLDNWNKLKSKVGTHTGLFLDFMERIERASRGEG